MIDLAILESKGCTKEKIRSILAEDDPLPEGKKQKDKHPQQEAVDSLRNRIRCRIQEGINNNLSNWKVFHALDLAWDTPFRQITPTLVGSLLDKDPENDKTVKATLDSWGLTHLITEEIDPKTKKPQKKLNLPAFFNIFVPLVKSYVTIRWAKILNDRHQVPFFKYEPAISTLENQIRCDVTTQRMEVMSNQYGYYEVMKKAVFNMLHYSICLQFPVEEWHFEEQYVRQEKKQEAPQGEAQPAAVQPEMPAPAEGETVEKKEKIETRKKRVKEGIRYHMPHPTRTFYDQAHRISTFNTDTGCTYAGYWRIMRYADIVDNTAFYNRSKVSVGKTDWFTSNTAFFQNVYKCVLQFPQINSEGSSGAGPLDRETKLASQFYTSEHKDKACLITEYFEKLIPSEYGFGDYDCPVWFRFVIASDNTIIYAAPVAYCPVIYYGYDADEGRDLNASMSLEILPFQDQFSNLMSQYILSCKQNLTNLTMVDKDIIEPSVLDQIKGWGENFFRKINFVAFSGRGFMRAQQGAAQAIYSHRFPNIDTNSLISAMKIILDTMERVLVMSAQEVAQAASHELRAEEVRNIAQSTSTRVMFTATPVDLATNAWKKQIYEGWMQYGEEDFMSVIPMDREITEKDLEAMGFSYVDIRTKSRMDGRKNMVIRAKKTAMAIETFAANRDGNDRINNVEAAAAMATFMRDLMANQITGATIGGEQAIRAANYIMQMAGFPRDFKLEAVGQDQVQQQIVQAMDMVLQKVGQALEPMAAKISDNSEAIKQIIQLLHDETPAPPPPTTYDNLPPTAVDGSGQGSDPSLVETAGGAPISSVPPALVGQV